MCEVELTGRKFGTRFRASQEAIDVGDRRKTAVEITVTQNRQPTMNPRGTGGVREKQKIANLRGGAKKEGSNRQIQTVGRKGDGDVGRKVRREVSRSMIHQPKASVSQKKE